MKKNYIKPEWEVYDFKSQVICTNGKISEKPDSDATGYKGELG